MEEIEKNPALELIELEGESNTEKNDSEELPSEDLSEIDDRSEETD